MSRIYDDDYDVNNHENHKDDNNHDNDNDNCSNNADHDVCRPGQVACQASSEENRSGRSPVPSCAPEFHLLQIIIGIMIFSIVIVVVTKFVHNLTTAVLSTGVSSSTLLVSLLSSSKVVTCNYCHHHLYSYCCCPVRLSFIFFIFKSSLVQLRNISLETCTLKCNSKTGLGRSACANVQNWLTEKYNC